MLTGPSILSNEAAALLRHPSFQHTANALVRAARYPSGDDLSFEGSEDHEAEFHCSRLGRGSLWPDRDIEHR